MTVKLSEKDFQRSVTDLAKLQGWAVYHVPAPMRALPGGKGFVGAKEAAGLCDLILFHEDPPRVIFAEVKSESGNLASEQVEFLRLARQVGETVKDLQRELEEADDRPLLNPGTVVQAFLWRPANWDLIRVVLS